MNADKLLREGKYKEAFKSYTLTLRDTPPEDAIPIQLKMVDCLSKMRQYTRAHNELLQLRFRVAIHIQNMALWISFLIPSIRIRLPEMHNFMIELGQRLDQWGETKCVRSTGEELEWADQIDNIRETVIFLTSIKRFLAKVLMIYFRVQM